MESYQKQRVIGRGAFGTVHLCTRVNDSRRVILKEIQLDQLTPAQRQLAVNEWRVLSIVQHPNVVRYYENFVESDRLVIAMEYADGGSLYDYLHGSPQPLPTPRILSYVAQLLSALSHIHRINILHRDLKTHNIFLHASKRLIKLGDFGISKQLGSLSNAVTLVGTPAYLAPELCQGLAYNAASDIWSLGCVVYEMCVGKRAFEGDNLPAVILNIMAARYPPIPATRGSPELRDLVMELLQLEPSVRPLAPNLMARPFLGNSLFDVYCSLGNWASDNTTENVTKSPVTSSHSTSSGKLIYFWGDGILEPLEFPSQQYELSEVAIGRFIKVGISTSGRAFVYERSGYPDNNYLVTPHVLEFSSSLEIRKVSCGDFFSVALTGRGVVIVFGLVDLGCLGHPVDGVRSESAHMVEALLQYEVLDVAAGGRHAVAVTRGNRVFVWGRGDGGRLGLGPIDSVPTPTEVQLPLFSGDVIALQCGADCTIAVTSHGVVLATGSNQYNKLCLNNNVVLDFVSYFQVIPFPFKVTQLAVGTSHVVMVTPNGRCFSCGDNRVGQLGCDGSPTGVASVAGLEGAVARVACGDTFTVAVTEDGRVWSWGYGGRGRLGRGDSPQTGEVYLPSGISAVSVVGRHAVAMVICDVLESANL